MPASRINDVSDVIAAMNFALRKQLNFEEAYYTVG
jgi:hypothetical protein